MKPDGQLLGLGLLLYRGQPARYHLHPGWRVYVLAGRTRMFEVPAWATPLSPLPVRLAARLAARIGL